ncbi:hypothetical protein OOZ15_10480 [Galbibacter sp. EGI 63066]|uniref:hypothetical protein n=1 Tax=Galbibacter sp. EGI 63066 TaxID=2993559 RepID=UPI002248AA44|nr:hypothetical protein [Galbibacter sp. EGI 63066]MCX2680367.1 hypothetical protein [Galbibacter sp. EGI 63066]
MAKKLFVLFTVVIFSIFISCDKDDAIEELPVEQEVIKVPEVKTHEVSQITVYSVKMGAEIVSPGASEVTEVGLVIGESSNPTIDDNFTKFTLVENTEGVYITIVESLPEEVTSYYIRAYAINEQGVGYGNEVQLTTLGNKTYHGGVVLSTQEEVVEFGNGKYNTIDGSLSIKGTVNDLSPLKDLFAVNTGFSVTNTTNLENFKGLENLKKTGILFPNSFRIMNNQALTSFLGLESLEITRGEFYVINNPSLINFEGLDSFFAASAGNMYITDCENLNSLTGLDKLEFIGDGLSIENNPKLTEINALGNLNFVPHRISIDSNNSLQNIDGLHSLENIETLNISRNPQLSNIDGIKNCMSLKFLELGGNESLTQLPSFQNITSIQALEVSWGGALVNLTGLENIKSMGTLKLNQSNIQSFVGLTNLEEVTYSFDVRSCVNLTDFNGLSNLRSVGDGSYYSGIGISGNDNLLSFNGLDKLTHIRGSFGVTENNALPNFNGLESLRTIEKTFNLSHNQVLQNINSISGLELLDGFHMEGNIALSHLPDFVNINQLNYFVISTDQALIDLSGLENLKSIETIRLQSSNLQSLAGLENLERVEDILLIERCDNITDLSGLNNLVFADKIDINYNNNIISLEGVGKLSTIESRLVLRMNPSLSSLNGLEPVTRIGDKLEIYNNASLSDFCSLTSFFQNTSYSGSYGVGNNLLNPTKEDLENSNCN